MTAPFIHIAHRGGGKLRPAHTIEAYANALAVGADMIELDLHATKDGVIVSIHDYTVDDTTDGKGFVKNKTWAELSALDAGYTFTPDGGKTHPYRGKGLKIARLDEVLKTFPKTWYCVEFKQHIPSIIEPVMTLFEAHGAIDRTIFSAFVDATIWDVRKRRPDALTAMAAAELLAFENLAEVDYGSYVSPAPFMQPPEELVTAEGVAKADAFGLKVQPWTVNNPTRMKEFIAMGVHGLFTDDPKTLAAILAP